MANTVVYADNFYTKPPKSGPEGAQFDYRSKSLLTGDLITTQLVALGVIPAGHRPVYAALEGDELDSGADAITASLGILNSNYNAALDAAPDLVADKNILTDSTIFQAGGRANPVLAFSKAIGVDYTYDRIVALKFTNAPNAAKAGTVALVLGTQPD